MPFQQQLISALIIAISAIVTSNMILNLFLGLCSYLAVSREMRTALGLGGAVIFVTFCTTVLNWIAYKYVLVPLKLEFFRFILFIIIIAAFVQFVEMVLERYFPLLYQNLGIFLPLITVNCAILGAALFMVIRDYTFIENIGWSFGAGVGWMLAIIALAGIRQRLAIEYIPKGLQGSGITLIITGLMALAFIGFAGVLAGQ